MINHIAVMGAEVKRAPCLKLLRVKPQTCINLLSCSLHPLLFHFEPLEYSSVNPSYSSQHVGRPGIVVQNTRGNNQESYGILKDQQSVV